MRISDWSSDVCSSDLSRAAGAGGRRGPDLALEFPVGAGIDEGRFRHCFREQLRPQAGGTGAARADPADRGDRKSVVEGKSVSVRVDLGGRRIINKKKNNRENCRLSRDCNKT